MNDLEQHVRANSIRISGIKDEKSNEGTDETIKKVVNLCSSKLGLKINQEEIDTAHRIGRFRDGKNRNIICKFVRRQTKFQVIKQRPKLKSSGVVIREDITRTNQELLDRAYQCSEIKSTWSSKGKLKVKTIHGDVLQIKDHQELDKIHTSYKFQ